MVVCIMVRKNKTLKYKKVKDKYDDFVFEDGTYYIRKDKILLKKKVFSFNYRSYLLFIEGISEPITFDNIEKKDKEDNTVLIDARSIHKITSDKILSVLSSSRLTTRDKLLIFGLVINIAICLSIVSMVM